MSHVESDVWCARSCLEFWGLLRNIFATIVMHIMVRVEVAMPKTERVPHRVTRNKVGLVIRAREGAPSAVFT